MEWAVRIRTTEEDKELLKKHYFFSTAPIVVNLCFKGTLCKI